MTLCTSVGMSEHYYDIVGLAVYSVEPYIRLVS